MMRNMMAGMALIALAGCGGSEIGTGPGAGPTTTAPMVTQDSHAALVASLGNQYAWNCTMQNSRGGAPWRFMLTREEVGRYVEVRLLEVGHPRPWKLVERKEGAALEYTLGNNGMVTIADDGEARGFGQDNELGNIFKQGRCTKGAQL
jgi:hypothetical protein